MDALVSTQWLADRLGADDCVVIDATKHLAAAGRDARSEFAAGHIPGARFLDLGALSDPESPHGKTLPGPALAAREFAALGLSPDDRIVLYDNSAIRSAARAWFILTGYGFDRVAILDGGLAKWRAEGRPLQTGDAGQQALAQPLTLGEFTRPVRRKEDMLANLDSAREQVVDARDPDRFSGASADTVHNLEGGHIPGARNLFFRDLYAEDGTFRPRAELAAAFEAAGLDITRPIAASCGSGVTASVLLFALHLLGHQGALYDGSWSEWGADPATPKQTGPAA